MFICAPCSFELQERVVNSVKVGIGVLRDCASWHKLTEFST
jgi:hypothetical protein